MQTEGDLSLHSQSGGGTTSDFNLVWRRDTGRDDQEGRRGGALGPFGAYLTDRFGVRGTHGVLAVVTTVWTVGPLLVARRATARRDV